MDKLPFDLNSFNRDELYTFILGLFIASVWYLYLLESIHINILLLISFWMGSTALLYILYFIVVYVTNLIIKEELKELKYENMKKLYYASDFKELKILVHIYGLIFTGFLLISPPLFWSIDYKINFYRCIFIVVLYILITLVCWYIFKKLSCQFLIVYSGIERGYIDIIDSLIYEQELAKYYSKRRIEDLEK